MIFFILGQLSEFCRDIQIFSRISKCWKVHQAWFTYIIQKIAFFQAFASMERCAFLFLVCGLVLRGNMFSKVGFSAILVANFFVRFSLLAGKMIYGIREDPIL